MNDGRRKWSGPALSDEEYINAVKLREELDKQIAEYENESRRGCVKVVRTTCGHERKHDGYSVRYDSRLGEKKPHWVTIKAFVTAGETLEFLRVMARDFPAAYEAFKAKHEEEPTNE